MSQQALGEKIGVEFGQIQKYEIASNRICASQLWQLGVALRVPAAWFFEGLTRDHDPVARAVPITSA